MSDERELKDDDVSYLTEWGCLSITLEKYGISIPDGITGKIGEHLVNDFMELMCKQGYIAKAEEKYDESGGTS